MPTYLKDLFFLLSPPCAGSFRRTQSPDLDSFVDTKKTFTAGPVARIDALAVPFSSGPLSQLGDRLSGREVMQRNCESFR